MTSHEFSVSESRSSYDRHQKVNSICSRLHRILAGRSAQESLAAADASGGASLPAFGSLAILPSWTWLHSSINVGRKDRADDGRRLLLPVRVIWQPGSVAVIGEGDTVSVDWTSVGLGNSGHGRTTITSGARESFDEPDQGANTPPAHLNLRPESRMTLHQQLAFLVADGKQAWWDLMMDMEGVLETALRRSHAHISAEIAGTDFKTAEFNPVLDPIGLQTVKDRMLVGDDESDTTVIGRLIEKCLKPTTFMKVEPTRYINITLDRDSKAAIRKAIGDPHIGSKIRNLAREVGHTNLPLLVAEYQIRHPADRLSSRRAAAALTVQPDPMAARTNFEDIDESKTSRQVRSSPVFRLDGAATNGHSGRSNGRAALRNAPVGSTKTDSGKDALHTSSMPQLAGINGSAEQDGKKQDCKIQASREDASASPIEKNEHDA